MFSCADIVSRLHAVDICTCITENLVKQVYAVFGISCQGNKQANFKCCIRTRTTHILCFYTENTSRGYHKMHQGGLMFFRLQFLCFIMAGVWRNITRQVQWEPVIFICLHVTVTLDLPWFTHKRITLRLFLTFADFVILLFTVHCTVNQNFEVSYIFLENSNQMFEYMKFSASNFQNKFHRCEIFSIFIKSYEIHQISFAITFEQ